MAEELKCSCKRQVHDSLSCGPPLIDPRAVPETIVQVKVDRAQIRLERDKAHIEIAKMAVAQMEMVFTLKELLAVTCSLLNSVPGGVSLYPQIAESRRVIDRYDLTADANGKD